MATKPTLPCPSPPSWGHGKKLSSFLAELVFGSQRSETSCGHGAEWVVQVQGTGQPGGEGTSLCLVGLSSAVVGNGGSWRRSAGALLSSLASPWGWGVLGLWVPKRAGTAPGTVYLSAQVSSEPLSCVPSPQGGKTAFVGHKRLPNPCFRNYSWKRNTTPPKL